MDAKRCEDATRDGADSTAIAAVRAQLHGHALALLRQTLAEDADCGVCQDKLDFIELIDGQHEAIGRCFSEIVEAAARRSTADAGGVEAIAIGNALTAFGVLCGYCLSRPCGSFSSVSGSGLAVLMVPATLYAREFAIALGQRYRVPIADVDDGSFAAIGVPRYLTATAALQALGLEPRSAHRLMADSGRRFSEWIARADLTTALAPSSGLSERSVGQ